MGSYQYICTTFLIQDAVMVTLRDESDWEFEQPNDLWELYTNSVDQNVREKFETAVELAYKFAPDECRTTCERVWSRVLEAPMSMKHRIVFDNVMDISLPLNISESVNTTIFKFMAAIAELCYCFGLGKQYCFIPTIVDAAALCLCKLRPSNISSMINLIDEASSEYLRTWS